MAPFPGPGCGRPARPRATQQPQKALGYSLVTMETGFKTSYLLSPHSFDGVVYTDGKMLPPPWAAPQLLAIF